ncbi:MAG: Peptidoglycan hydrolase, partial [Pseudomonadota bacterium]|nr:Peptidoglycan hydrolase [Pseudomonadota bacterium]
MVFKKGDFTTYVGETPEQLARRRAVVAAVTPKFGSAKTVGEGLGQLFMGIGLGRQQRAFDEAEAAGRKEGTAAFSGLFGNTTQSTSGQSGPMNILGVDPGYAAPPTEGA